MEDLALAEYALLLMLGLEAKHFLADYLLQFDWMIRGKGSFARAGGYVHAGIHVAGTVVILLVLAVPTGFVLLLAACEFVIHYLLDFSKANYGDHVSSADEPRKFWALNGLDQLFHHLTYIAMVWVMVHSL